MVTVTSAAVDGPGAVGLGESLPHALTRIAAPITTITSGSNEEGFIIGTTPLHQTGIDRGKWRADVARWSSVPLIVSFERNLSSSSNQTRLRAIEHLSCS